MKSHGNHVNHCLLGMYVVVTTIPNFKFQACPILEILPAGLLDCPRKISTIKAVFQLQKIFFEQEEQLLISIRVRIARNPNLREFKISHVSSRVFGLTKIFQRVSCYNRTMFYIQKEQTTEGSNNKKNPKALT